MNLRLHRSLLPLRPATVAGLNPAQELNPEKPPGRRGCALFQSAPLGRHRIGDALIGPAPFLPAVRAGAILWTLRLVRPDTSSVGTSRGGLQPKAGRLGFPMPELPRLTIWSGLRMREEMMLTGFSTQMRGIGVPSMPHEVKCLGLLGLFVREPARPLTAK